MGSKRADHSRHLRPQPVCSILWRSAGRRVMAPIAGVVGLAALAVNAQESAAPARGMTLETSLGIRETLTDNVNLSGTNRRAELVTELSPQLRLSSRAGRVRGFLDYSLSGLIYARESSSNNVQHALNASGTAEVVDQWAYVDASANISQQLISALGTQSADAGLINANRTEVVSAQLSPYLRGRVGGLAEYEARLTWAKTDSKDSNADSTSTQALLRLGSARGSSARIGWSVDASHQTFEFNSTGSRDSDRLNASLSFAVTPELRLSARRGREFNDLLTPVRRGYDTWGGGVTWTPTERTVLEASGEHRYFGNSHSIRFEHRMPRSVWTFADSQDVSTDASSRGAGGPRTVFDLLYQQFASIAPDPAQRAALVDAFLQNYGLTRASLLSGGFLTSAASIQRRQNASAAVLGARSTVLVSLFRSDARPLDPAAVGIGDLSNGNTLHERGFSVNLSHRLTPLSGLSVDFSQTKARASLGNQSTDLKSLAATWTNRLGERADLSVSARRSQFSSATSPYTENAVTANLRLRF